MRNHKKFFFIYNIPSCPVFAESLNMLIKVPKKSITSGILLLSPVAWNFVSFITNCTSIPAASSGLTAIKRKTDDSTLRIHACMNDPFKPAKGCQQSIQTTFGKCKVSSKFNLQESRKGRVLPFRQILMLSIRPFASEIHFS